MKPRFEKMLPLCDLSDPSKFKAILQSFHPLAIFGQIFGFFPIQKVLVGFSTVKEFSFDLLSLPTLYSIILNLIFYIIALEVTWDYWIQRRNLFKFSTDAFAIQAFLAVYFFLRFTLHLLCIYRAPKVLECLKFLQTYDDFFNYKNKTTFFSRYMLIYLLGTTVNIVGNVSASFPGMMRTIYRNFNEEETGISRYLIFNLIPNPDVLGILTYAIHIVAESALFFSHCSITFIITGICDRISAIKDEIDQISQEDEHSFIKPPNQVIKEGSQNQILSMWINQIHSFPSLPDGQKSICTKRPYFTEDVKIDKDCVVMTKINNRDKAIKLKTLCNQYVALADVTKLLNEFAKETMAVFTAGSAVMLVALFYLICILLTQYVPMSSNRIKESGEIIPIVFIAVITFLRLMNFTNIGEKLRCDVSNN
ncbi:unnamed protein product [Orchesella dallaii]|uniref:Gustatory receptor n=1 Tax=Orchesella dallaii TaxID=48710 RepID=A0ABP1PK53_9HEXA